MNRIISAVTAISLSLLFSGAALATCPNPLNIKDASASIQPMSTVQLPDGNCGSNQAPQTFWTGTSNNGVFGTALTMMTTELNSLANAAVIVSSVGGTSGLFTNSNTGAATKAELFFKAGTAGASCAVGGSLAGWFLQSSDGGTTFESTTTAPTRSPDFVFALPATTLTATFKAVGQIILPALEFKVLVQNNCGASGTLNASGNTIVAVPVATIN